MLKSVKSDRTETPGSGYDSYIDPALRESIKEPQVTYTFSTAVTLQQQFGTKHAAAYLAKAGAPLAVALEWLL